MRVFDKPTGAGGALARAMESQGMQQRFAADLCGISPASMNNICNGRSEPTLAYIYAIWGKLSDDARGVLLDGLRGVEPVSGLGNATAGNIAAAGRMADGGDPIMRALLGCEGE